MSTTFGELKASLRQLLADKSTWSDQALDRWAKEAIRDYSVHFPQQLTASISVTAGVRSYDLASTLGSIYHILQVEYPVGEIPPVYLTRLTQDRTAFLGGETYDLAGNPITSLILGKTPAAGESIGLTYTAPHTQPASDEVYLSVPDEGLEVLRLYVTWKARLAVELDSSTELDRQPQVQQANSQSAVQAWRRYYEKITELEYHQAQSSFSGPWSMDERDRVY